MHRIQPAQVWALMGAWVFFKGKPCGWCMGHRDLVLCPGWEAYMELFLSWYHQWSNFCVPWGRMIIIGNTFLNTFFSASESWRIHIFFNSILTYYSRETRYHWMPLAMKTSVHLRRQNSPIFRWEHWGRRDALGQSHSIKIEAEPNSPGICSCLMFLKPNPTWVHPRLKGSTGSSTLNTGCSMVYCCEAPDLI